MALAASVLFGLSGAAWLRWPIAIIALLVALATASLLVGALRLRRDVVRKADTEIEIDYDGIRLTRPYPQSVSWEEACQVDIVSGNSQLAVHTATDRNVLRVPLTSLTAPADEVIDAVRRYSHGRFPTRH